MANPNPTFAGGTRRLLVIDDDPSVREMLVRVLRGDGYAAWPVTDGTQALAFAAAGPVDLVLLDLGLPEKDGWETLDGLRRQNPRLAVIVITARANQRAAAQAAGADALFEKPLDFPELLRTVGRLLADPSKPPHVPGTKAGLVTAASRGSEAR